MFGQSLLLSEIIYYIAIKCIYNKTKRMNDQNFCLKTGLAEACTCQGENKSRVFEDLANDLVGDEVQVIFDLII